MCAIAVMCSIRNTPRIRRTPLCSIRPPSAPPLSSIRKSLEKQRADEVEYAQLVKDDVPVAPVYSGLDGGMNKVFLARYPDRIIPLARVLPPTGSQLPEMPAIPWTDNDSSLASRFFGASPESKPPSQVQVAATSSTAHESSADSATAGSAATPATKPAPQSQVGIAANDEWIVAAQFQMGLLDLFSAKRRNALARFNRPCERDQICSRMLDQRFAHFFAITSDNIHDTLRKFGKDFLQR